MKNMKQKIFLSTAVIFSAALLPIVTLKAQDTVRVRETTVVHDTENKDKNKNNSGKLYMGEFGVRYLPTFTSLNVSNYNGDVVQGNASMSNGVGIMLGHNFSKYTGLELEINYDNISQKYKDHGLDKKVSISYINIPLLLSINTDKTNPIVFGVAVGPQLGVNIGSKISGKSAGDSDTLHAVVAVKGSDVGVAYGAGFGIALTPDRNVRLDFGFRGVYGLVDINGKTTGDNTYNIIVKGSRKSYGAYLGITFLF
jgi:hypothetical protein